MNTHTKIGVPEGCNTDGLPLLSASHSSSRMPFFPANLEELNTSEIAAPLTNLGKAGHEAPFEREDGAVFTFSVLDVCHFCMTREMLILSAGSVLLQVPKH